MTEREAYDELTAWSLGLRDPAFPHQLVVDAWALQQADATTRPISVLFALVTLYLHLERGFTGRQAQLIHLQLAQHKEAWPRFALPESRGSIRAGEVFAAPAGPARMATVEAWGAEQWSCYGASQAAVADYLAERGISRD